MTVRAGTHVRSLRMRPELAEAVRRAASRRGIAQNAFIVRSVSQRLERLGELDSDAAGLDLEALLDCLRWNAAGLSASALARRLSQVIGPVNWWELKATLARLEDEGRIVSDVHRRGPRRRWRVWRLVDAGPGLLTVLMDPFSSGRAS